MKNKHNSSFICDYWITMRPYLMYVSGMTGMLGLSLGNLSSFLTILYGFIFFLSYGFGQALTDCFQIDTDKISSPYRPLVKGTIQKKDVIIISMLCLFISGAILAYANIYNGLLAAAGIMGLTTYTFFKRRWWVGPFYNAWIVACLGLMGFLCGGVSLAGAFANPSLLGYLLTIFFGYANFVLIGYFKDIEADAKTGYFTFPVVFGRKAAAWASLLLAILTVLVPFNHAFKDPQWQSVLLLTTGSAFLLLTAYKTFQIKHDHEAHQAIAYAIHAYLLILGSLICFQKPSWFGWIVMMYFSFVLTLNQRPMKQQI
jgi:4-hydroxybenzoate polyprenyltransferase